jgi:hypothetical protein
VPLFNEHLNEYGDRFSFYFFDVDLEPFGLFDVDNCGVEDVIDVAGVNFTYILRAASLYESVSRNFFLLIIWLCNFLANDY